MKFIKDLKKTKKSSNKNKTKTIPADPEEPEEFLEASDELEEFKDHQEIEDEFQAQGVLKAEFEMLKPQYNLSRLDPELLRFLKYTRNFTSCCNAIPLSMLQNGFVTFYDIIMIISNIVINNKISSSRNVHTSSLGN